MSTGHHRAQSMPAAVTGIGLITCLGRGVKDNWDALVAGRSGLRRIERFPTAGLRSTVAGCVDFMGPQPYTAFTQSLAMATAVAEEALAQAGIGSRRRFPGPLYLAGPPAELEWPQLQKLAATTDLNAQNVYRQLAALVRREKNGSAEHELSPHVRFAALPDAVSQSMGTVGMPVSVCTACASGLSAIQLGLEAIRRGETEAALCVGVDATVHPEGLMRFSLLSALSTHNDPPEAASRPFSKDRAGFVIAEGAAALVLETPASARQRGAHILGYVRGFGEGADHYHRTRSKPDASAIIAAIQGALLDAGAAPDDIDYVNAHGTSTPENDSMEYKAMRAVFGERVHRLPVSSNKSMIGHTLIAAGAVEAVISLKTIEEGILPPTLNYRIPDPAIPLDVVPNASRRHPVRTVLKNSFGFGGQNVCAIFSSVPSR